MKKLAVSSLVIAFILTLSTLAVVLPTSAEPTPSIYDDFNDNSINTSLWTAYTVGTGPSIYETNQTLGITFPANSSDDPADDIFGARLASTCRLTGDFDIQVDYSLLVWPSENGVRVGLGVEEAPIDFGTDHAAVERDSFASNEFGGHPSEVYCTDFDDGVQGITNTSDTSGKLRLVRVNTTASGYYFANGSWVLVHSGNVSDADAYFTISSWSHDLYFADQMVHIAYDNMIINQGSLVCGPEPTPTPTINATATPVATATPTETPVPTETPAPPFNASDWAYNQSGTVTASGECGNLSDYQIRFDLHYGSGTDSGSDIYLGGLCRPDFGDVRFTKADGVTLLDHWMQELNTGSNATVWVEFDSISTAGTEFYIYYGNPNASSTSSGPDTCLIFDDLESGGIDTDTWNVKQSYGSVGIKTDKKFGEYSIGSDQAAGQGGGLDMYDQNHYFLKLDDGADAGYRVLMDAKRWYTTAWPGHFCGFGFGGTNELRALASPEQYRHNGFPPTDTWHSYETRIQRINASAVGAVIIEDDIERYDGMSNVTQGSELQFGVQTRHNGIWDNTIYVRSDNVCVGSYCDPEPTIDWGGFDPDDWSYNQSGTVTASGECGNLSDYQVRFTVHYGSGTSSGSDIYLGGLCQPGFEDVRFTKADGVTLLDYWQETSKIGPYNSSVFWVEFDQISPAGTDFYIYYGNPSAESESNGRETFIIFTDGADFVAEEWAEHPDGCTFTWLVEEAEGGNKVIRATGYGFGWSNRYQEVGLIDYVAECRIRAQYSMTTMNEQQGIGHGAGVPMARWIETGDYWQLRDPWGHTNSEVSDTFNSSQWHDYSFTRDGLDWQMHVDGDLKVTRTATPADYTYTGMYAYTHESGHWAEFDDFRVRNYCDPEPTLDWGEEPQPTPTPEPTFDPADWSYNQSGTVTASGECGNLSDYQVRFNLHYGSGANNGSDIYLGGLCQPDFDDVRFTRADGVTPLDYWQEKGAVNPYNDSVFWVEFDQISTAGTEFYIYYGNPNVSSASDGEATWDFFDDFDGTEVDMGKWDAIGSPNGTVSNSELYIIKTENQNDTVHGYKTEDTFDDCRMVSRAKTGYTQTAASAWIIAQYNGRKCSNKVEFRKLNDIYLRGDTMWCGANVTNLVVNDNFSLNTYYTYYYVRKGAEHIRAWENGELVGEVTSNILDMNSPAAMGTTFWDGYLRTHDFTIDWFGVGKYCDPEPTIDWGEEPTPTPTATPTETPAPTFNPADWAYNQSGTVTASGECGNLSDYQVQLDLHYGVGTSSGSDFYLGGLCQPDFDDVRFTRADGVTLLDYWMEEVNAGVDATVWVEFDQISTAGTEFYIYYGNPNASSASDGDATFMFFDGFGDGVVDTVKWAEIYEDGGDWVKEEGGVIELLGSTSGFGNRAMVRSDFIPTDVNVKVHSSIRMENIQKNGSKYYDHFSGIWNEYYYASKERNTHETTLAWRTGYQWHNFNTWLLSIAWDLEDVAEIPALDATYHDLISWIEPGKTCHTMVDGADYSVSSTHPFNTSQAAYLQISLRGEGKENSCGCTADVFADYVFARNYCDPEPTIDWGEGPIPPPTPTASATSTPEVADVWIDFVDSPGVNVTLRAATNSEFIVRTNISGVEDLKIAQYDITYDPGVVHVQKVSGWIPDVRAGKIGVDSFPVMSASFVPAETRGRIRVIHNLEGVQGVSGSGYMSSIYFKVVGSPKETTPIEISIETLDNVALQPIPHNTTNSSVLVVLPWQAGDANLDNVINAGDITKSERIIMGWDAATNLSDANVDGAVNASDIGVIEYKILEIWPWDRVYIEAPDSAACGSDFFATLYVNYVQDFGSASCEVSYDSGILDLVDVTGGELQGVPGTSSDFHAIGVTDWGLIGGPGRVRINSSVAGGGGVSGAGYLARLRFHVDGSAWQASPIAFNGSESWLRDALGGDIAVTWEDNSVVVAP